MRTYVRMAHSRYLRQMARSLRIERQLTVDELAARLALPRSTIYYWVRDLPLREDRHRGGPRGKGESSEKGGQAVQSGTGGVSSASAGETPQERSEAAYEEGLESFEELAAQPTFRDFVCIYLLVGEQRDRARVALGSSDPAVMRLVSRWLRRLTDGALSLTLQHSPEHSLGELLRFWSEAVGAEQRAIRTRTSGSARSTRRSREEVECGPGAHGHFPRHGLLTVAVQDTLLRARLQGWMQRAREDWR